MRTRDRVGTLMLLMLALGMAWAQDSSPQPQDSGQQPEVPAPVLGENDRAAAAVMENPPISGIDLPGLEPHAAPLSYLQAGAHIAESADSNVANQLGTGQGVHSITRALGSLELQRLWSNYDLALDYVGGVGYYNVSGVGFKQLQELAVDQRIKWKRGQLAVRDSFSYLPEGNFAGAYGSLNSTGQALGGFTGGGIPSDSSSLGGLGLIPRITNVALVDVTENLTPKSSVTATGGYNFVHFTGSNPSVEGVPFLGSTEVSGQAGYNRIVGPHDQVAFVYAYQGFDFPDFHRSFHTHVLQAMWGHRISGRMDFLAGAGPQITFLQNPCTIVDVFNGNSHCNLDTSGNPVGNVPDRMLNVAGRASLRYRFTKTYLQMSYERFTTAGSGLFPGANSNIGRLSATRPLTRVWSVFTDVGYSHNSRVLPGSSNPATKFSSVFAGAGVHRKIGHDFRAFASYQFNYLTFDKTFCGLTSPCSRTSDRQAVLLGLDWTPRPIRLD